MTIQLITLETLAADRRRIENDLLDAVMRARAEGQSWTAIGEALGVSRQAAREKYCTKIVETKIVQRSSL